MLEEILIKASILKDFYSTNIYGIFSVAKYIFNLNIDGRVERGNISVIEFVKLNALSVSQDDIYL